MGDSIGEVSDPETRYCGCNQSGAVVGLEASLRANREDLVAIHELPGFGALHEGLMGDELLRRFRRPMRFDIVRTRDELPINRSDTSCDQVGVLKIADPDRAIITLCDDIDETVAVAGVDVKLGVALRHFREHVREVSRAERKRHSNSQATAKVTGG